MLNLSRQHFETGADVIITAGQVIGDRVEIIDVAAYAALRLDVEQIVDAKRETGGLLLLFF